MKCEQCGKELYNGGVRPIVIDGEKHFFCLASVAPIPEDCGNKFLRQAKQQEQMLHQATR